MLTQTNSIRKPKKQRRSKFSKIVTTNEMGEQLTQKDLYDFVGKTTKDGLLDLTVSELDELKTTLDKKVSIITNAALWANLYTAYNKAVGESVSTLTKDQAEQIQTKGYFHVVMSSAQMLAYAKSIKGLSIACVDEGNKSIWRIASPEANVVLDSEYWNSCPTIK